MSLLNRAVLFGRALAVAVVVVSSLNSLTLAQPGRGQGGGWGGGWGGGGGGWRDWSTPVSTAHLKKYGSMLALTADQDDAAKMLLEGYQQQVRKIEEEMRSKREAMAAEFRETRDPEVWTGMREAMTKARDERQRIESTFFGDFKSILTAEQVAKFPKVERARRRDSTLSRGRLSGERVDIVRLVEEMKLEAAEKQSIDPIVEQYEEELDRELAKRNAVYEEIMGKMGEMMRNRDMEAAQKELERGREAGMRVRDLNRKYSRQISDILPEARRADLKAAVDRASFPEVFRETQTAKSIEAAGGFADLDEDQKTAIASLKQSFTQSISGLNAKLAVEIERSETEITVERMFNRGPEEGPAMDLRRQRRDLERTAADNLKKILRPDQVERLPKPEPENDGGRDGQRRRERANRDRT